MARINAQKLKWQRIKYSLLVFVMNVIIYEYKKNVS